MRIHKLMQHLEVGVEVNMRVWRYLLPPMEEEEGHNVKGSLPLWWKTQPTSHFLCDKGNI